MKAGIRPGMDGETPPGRGVGGGGGPWARINPRRFALNPGRLAATAEADTALGLSSPLWVGRTGGTWCPFGSGTDLDGDQRRDDGGSLVFDSGPLTEPIEILGAPMVALEA